MRRCNLDSETREGKRKKKEKEKAVITNAARLSRAFEVCLGNPERSQRTRPRSQSSSVRSTQTNLQQKQRKLWTGGERHDVEKSVRLFILFIFTPGLTLGSILVGS